MAFTDRQSRPSEKTAEAPAASLVDGFKNTFMDQTLGALSQYRGQAYREAHGANQVNAPEGLSYAIGQSAGEIAKIGLLAVSSKTALAKIGIEGSPVLTAALTGTVHGLTTPTSEKGDFAENKIADTVIDTVTMALAVGGAKLHARRDDFARLFPRNSWDMMPNATVGFTSGVIGSSVNVEMHSIYETGKMAEASVLYSAQAQGAIMGIGFGLLARPTRFGESESNGVIRDYLGRIKVLPGPAGDGDILFQYKNKGNGLSAVSMGRKSEGLGQRSWTLTADGAWSERQALGTGSLFDNTIYKTRILQIAPFRIASKGDEVVVNYDAVGDRVKSDMTRVDTGGRAIVNATDPAALSNWRLRGEAEWIPSPDQ